ncbi:dihydroorotate dehydrogenase electron transfer subunit [Candidatus Magnetominusculus dajiuhuensis]|uniref:iron-sulfur cluster-binding protein n=1 Tax=Candidatus Magnetominusculus dajiuhuensis TaxID=3137712 RepID=UPI003B42C5C4
MIGPGEYIDPLLLRPFSLADITPPDDKHPNGSLIFFIRVAGKGTNILKRLTVGTSLSVIGPLGLGFPPVADDEKLLVVAGGIGIASVLGLTKKYQGVPLFYGDRTKGRMLNIEWLEMPEDDIHITTDDGSCGKKCGVLEFLESHISQLRESYTGKIKIYACGPHGMYRAMAGMNLNAEVYVSLETPMACGVGTCLGCAVDTVNGLKMVCKDGPVFNLKDIIWDG